MLVTFIFISFLLFKVLLFNARGLAALSFFLSSSMRLASLVLADLMLMDPCGPGAYDSGGVPGRPREPTRTGGTEPAMNPPPGIAPASAGRDAAVRPPSIQQTQRPAARAGASTQSAASCE